MDGDGKHDPMLASMIHHIPYRACGSIVSTGFVFVMSSAHFQAADALDGETDGEIRVDTLHLDVEPAPPVVREITQFEDSVVVMRVSGSLKTAELDFDALADGFYARYEDEFDYLVFISNLPTLNYSQRHQYYGIHMDVSNTVRGTGRRVYDSGGTLKSMIHFPYRDPILYGPSLHEIMHSWANYAIPTVEPVHWGFSSANGQLGGFDLANLVDLGNGRYSAGRFGTFANGGNSLPYSPMELYFAGLIPPEEVPDLLVAKDGEWAGEREESGNSIFTASDVETWSVRRVVEEHGVRAPDWRSSQKSFRAAVVLITDDGFPATSATLRELREALRTFSHPGSDGNDGSFNFWEATGGRAAIKMDDLQGSGVPVVTNQPPAPAGVLAPLTIAVDGAAVTVDVSAAFRDPDGDRLTYGATSSAPGIASVVAFGSAVIVTPVSEGRSTVTVTATDTEGSNTTAAQTFTVTVSPPANRPPVPAGTLAPVTLEVDGAAVTVDLAGAFRDPDGDRLTYGTTSSAPGVASVVVFGSAVVVTPVSEGTATVMVTATDVGGSNTTATQRFAVTVRAPANRPPEPVGTLAPLRIAVDEAAATVAVSGAFRDPDGDVLTYGATSSAPRVATVSASGSVVTVTPVSEGTTTVTVTATDTGGSSTSAMQSFLVTVRPRLRTGRRWRWARWRR